MIGRGLKSRKATNWPLTYHSYKQVVVSDVVGSVLRGSDLPYPSPSISGEFFYCIGPMCAQSPNREWGYQMVFRLSSPGGLTNG